MFRLAPLIPALAILPELVQHYVEFDIRMFASKAAFKAHQMDQTRWMVGYFKIAGYVLAIVGAAFYWGTRGHLRWKPSTKQAGRFALALAINIAFGAVQIAIHNILTGAGQQAFYWISTLAGLPLVIFLIGTMFNDQSMSLRQAFTGGWLRMLSLAMCAGIPVALGQVVHRLDHNLAMAAPAPVVWALMIWDAIWVGLMACWIGTGLAFGYGRKASLQTKS